LEGQPADLRDLRHNLVNGPPDTWKEPSLFRPSSFLSPSVVDAHAFVPLGWPAWVASKATTGIPVLPFVVSMGGLGLVCAGGLRRAWRIHGQAILMTEKPGTPATAQAAPSKADRRGLSRAALAKASSFLRPLRPFPSDASCLVRAMTRQWRRSVEIRFLIITACALAAGAVVASIYLQYAEADILGAFRITCGMAAVLILAYATLFLNQFGYDRGGCRAMMLAPVSARTVLMAKNLATGRLVLLTSVPFAVLIAVITGQWTSTLVVWVFLLPAAILLTLALGNSSSIAFPFPVRIGQRAQMRAAAGGLTRGLLNFLLYLLIALVLQIPQIAASAAGPWVGYAAAAGVFAGAAAIWKMSFEAQAMQLAWRMGEVADTVGRATDM
jgi:hypothetical protein